MRPFNSRATQPTPAERVLSILTAAHSMTVVSDGHEPVEVHRLDGTGAMGHIHLHAPLDEAGPAQPGARIPVRLELTDIAPTPVRDRMRARVTVTGLLLAEYSTEATASTCMEFGQAVLDDVSGRAFVTHAELQATAPDPIATSEATMLTHLVDGHRELLPLLLRLAQPQPAKGMVRVLPLAMDRYGVTLRLEYPGTHRDVRLPFAKTVTRLDQAGPQILSLLAAARRASHPNRLLA
ncbi:DUF2470 domain-containing protein [Streptomyces sp. NPDC059398]|uniref:DUF2470 domain-containing protein n=1 Tax=Streptomyces sp. NPDC059398 TaxID=3346820 RepID=UPI00367C19DE